MIASNALEIDPSTTQLMSKTSNRHNTSEKPPAKVHLSFWHRYQNSWYPELTALALSVSCVIAIAIVLKRSDGKANPRMKLGLTLNAVISVLATTSKVSLIFTISNSIGQLKWVWFLNRDSRSLRDASIYDDASRGPLGSLLMLWTETRKSIASFGAILILLAVVYDPFIQQIISLEAILQLQPVASGDVLMNAARSFRVSEDSSGTSDVVRRAINAAYWTDLDSPWNPSCPREHCKWPIFESLAWHAKCYEDRNWTLSEGYHLRITTQEFLNLRVDEPQPLNCSLTRASRGYFATRSGAGIGFKASYSKKDFNLDSIPASEGDESVLESPDPPSYEYNGTSLMVMPTYDIFSYYSTVPVNVTDSRESTYNVSAPVMILGVFGLILQDDLSMMLNVTTCELDLFLDTYQLVLDSGVTLARLNTTMSLLKSFVNQSSNMCDGDAYGLNLYPSTLSGDPVDPSQDQNVLAGSTSKSTCPSVTQYRAVQNLIYYALQSKFPLTRTTIIDRNILGNFSDLDLPSPFRRQNLSSWNDYGTGDEIYMWNGTDPEHVMENFAKSFNKLMLDPTRNPNGTVPVYGRASMPTTIVKVTWPWVILPFGLCVSTIMFFFVTVYLSHAVDAPLWKSSINASFYHGIDFDSGIWTPLTTIPEMDAQAAMTRANLAPMGIFKRLMLETSAVKR